MESTCQEKEILYELSKGSHWAFEHIYNRFHTQIFVVAHRYIRSEDEAKDIRSKCFTKLWELREKLEFDSMGALFSWLRTIASNSCIDFLRKENIREAKELDIITHYWQEHYNDTFESSDKEAVILDRLLKQIDQLPPKFKQVFKMRWLNDLKFREISDQIGADISTVKKRYARALTLLRKCVLFI